MLQMGYKIVMYILAALTIVTGISIFVLYMGYSEKSGQSAKAGADVISEDTVSYVIPRLSEIADVVETKEDNRMN